jgi:hypothetical protein
MPPIDRAYKDTLKLGVRALLLQEVRLLRLEQSFAPDIVVDDMIHSIRGTKKEIVKLVKVLDDKERATLLRRMIRKAVDEAIDRAIELRKTKCVRCLHGRFYDEEGTAHLSLPLGGRKAQTIGCDRLRPGLKKSCRLFSEAAGSLSLEETLREMTLLYELREMFDEIEEIWKDYFLTR